MESDFPKMHICFPIVWNALIEGRIAKGQVNQFNTLFGSNYHASYDSDRSEINKIITGTKNKKIDSVLRDNILQLETEDRTEILEERVRSINIKAIRDVVSAFHKYQAEHLLINPSDMSALQKALKDNNPELYVASALIAGLHFDGVPKGYTKEMVPMLRKLESETEYEDAFKSATRASDSKNSVSSDMVHGESLALLWGKVRAKEEQNPGSVSLRTKTVIEQMNEDEAEVCLTAAKYLLVRGGMSLLAKHNIEKPSFMFLSIEDAHTVNLDSNYRTKNSPEYLFDQLEECGLIYNAPFAYEVDSKRINCLFSTVSGNMVADLEPTRDMQNIFNIMLAEKNPQYYQCYNLTRAGMELFSCLEPATDRSYFFDLCEKLKKRFTDLAITVYEVNHDTIKVYRDKFDI